MLSVTFFSLEYKYEGGNNSCSNVELKGTNHNYGDTKTNDPLLPDKSKDNTQNRYQCVFEGCERTYSTIGNLRTHIKAHNGMVILFLFKTC